MNHLIYNYASSAVDFFALEVLTLKAPNKIAADDTFIYLFFLLLSLKKIRLGVSSESSA